MALDVHIVSTERSLWEGKASHVSAPSVEGSVGILPGRQPLLAALTKGKVVVRQDATILYEIEAEDGFLSVDSDRVIVALDQIGAMDEDDEFSEDIQAMLDQ